MKLTDTITALVAALKSIPDAVAAAQTALQSFSTFLAGI